jgi:ribonuclease HIII
VFAKLGLAALNGEVAEVMSACSAMIRRASAYQAQALFVDASDVGWVLGVQIVLNQDGKVTAFPSVDDTMEHQARAALEPHLDGRGAHWDIEWPVSFGGASVGLSLYVSLLVATNQLKPDPLMAVTGSVDIGGGVHGVEGIGAKLRAAAGSGMRRVVLPEDNRPEAEASEVRDQLDLIFVRRTAEVRSRLMQATARASVGFDGLVRYVRHLLPLAGLEVGAEESRPGFHRFKAGDSGGGVQVDVYPNGTVRASGPAGGALEAARKLITEQLDSLKPQTRPPLVRNVPTPDRRARLLAILEEAAATELPANQHEAWRRRLARGGSQATIVLYESGKCVVQGQAPAFDDADDALNVALHGLTQPESPTQASQAPSRTPAVDPKAPHIGTDEAGKGDFFGPLVSAAVYVDSRLASQLLAAGVKDSKLLTDASVKRIAAEIRALLGNRARVTLVPPKRFNELYAQMRSEGKNLNTLLAWSHTRSIEDLITAGLKPEYVVIDQFGDRKYIEGKLLADTRQSGIPIVQMPKAEADVAVAAASILARDGFLDWLQQAAQRLGRLLPKGASDQVIAAAREIVATQGRDALTDIAKVSFKTMEKVLAP